MSANTPATVPVPNNVVPLNVKQPRVSASVELPSMGLFYGDACKDGIIELYPITGRDEALTTGMDDMVEIFDLLLTRCLKTPISVDDMLSTDKFYLMLMLRANSYGDYYEFRVRCVACGIFMTKHCSVPGDFKVTKYTGTGVEPFTVELPRSKKTVGLRLLRGRDDKAITAYKNAQLEKYTGPGDPAYVYRMAKSIVTIDGIPPANIGEATEFFENLVGMDSSAIQTAIEDQTSGVSTEMDAKCVRCKTAFKVDMPFTPSFFRTQTRKP